MTDPNAPMPVPAHNGRRAAAVALVCASIAVGMVGMAYAAVPLYRIFCQVTGYGGTTQKAEAASHQVLDRDITVRFDANANKIEWDFRPAQTAITLKVGENGLAHYSATNLAGRPVTGQAVFNVTPLEAGAYFNKIECFCFTEQTLQPGESVDMPVTFFVDPEIASDPELDDVRTITLSYTFFETDPPADGDDVALHAPDAPNAKVN